MAGPSRRGPIALALAALGAAPGCAHAPLARQPPAAGAVSGGGASERELARRDGEQLLDAVRAAHRIPETLSGDAKAFVDAAEGGGRYALLFAVQRPASLRIEALMPWGEPAATLVAHRGRFLLRDDRHRVFLRGPSTPRNLARLLPSPLRDDELAALLCGALPELPGAEVVRAEDAGDGRRRLLSSTLPGGEALSAVRGFSQEALVGADLRLLEIRRFTAGGTPELLWAATLDEHEDRGGAQVPRLLHLHIPKESSGAAQDVEIDLRIKSSLAGKPPPPAAFTLVAPPGMRVEELE